MPQSSNWTEAVIQSLQDITPTVREFTLAPTQGAMAFEPGSHLQVQVLINGKPQTRSYSLVGPPDGSTYRIAVKCLPEGRGGSLALWCLGEGDRLRISPPKNQFSLDLNAPAYLLVAGGIGITPLVQMAQTLARRGAVVKLLHGARTDAELAFAPLLKACLGDRPGCLRMRNPECFGQSLSRDCSANNPSDGIVHRLRYHARNAASWL